MRAKKSIYNVVFGITSQIIIIALGLIVPRVTLTNYGSDVNGFTSTVRQIFTYMALLEAGIGQSTLNSLYEPVAKSDRNKISSLLTASLKYYRKITRGYFGLVLLMSFLLPFGLNTEINPLTAGLVVFFEGISAVIGFYYLEAWKQLLSADGRYYVTQNLSMLSTVLIYGMKIALSCMGVNIAIIQAGNFIVSLVQMITYKIYCKKKYPWVDFSAEPDNTALKDRYSFMASQVAATVFSSTDMIVISVFCGTLMASVYSIYNLIYSNLNNLLNAVYFGLIFILGQTWKADKEKYTKLHDAFDGMSMWLITATMSVAYILTMPFVKIYTSGIKDVNYVYDSLPLLFALVQMLSWSRYVSGNLVALGGYAKQVSKISLLEAAINLFLSIALVGKLGIVGALFATVIALPIKVIYCMYVGNRKIIQRSVISSLKILIVNYILFGLAVLFQAKIDLGIDGMADFLKAAVLISAFIYPVYFIVNIMTNRSMKAYSVSVLKKFLRR